MQGLPEIGDVLDGNYKILSKLGAGGFGAVFLANHIPMDREVALKMLLAHGPRPEEMVERFRREVMATRVLSHPNTVRIFDYKDRDDHLLYYTMEHLKGQTLKKVTKTLGPQSPLRVRHITRQVLKSLSEAHSYKIIHRDLKPANIMLVDMHGETDFVKVLDFGIAKIMDTSEEENEEDQLTSAGMLVGTLRYMAPEQITGAPLGPMTDLYSLGLIMTELLVGKSVFAGTGRWEVFQKQISEEPIELPTALLQSPLGPIISKALSKRSDQRFANAVEMIKALEAIPEHQLSLEPLVYQDEASFGESDSNTSNPSAHSGAFSTSAISSTGPLPSTPAFNENAPTMLQDISDVSRPAHAHVSAHPKHSTPPLSEDSTQHLEAQDLEEMGALPSTFSPPSDDTFDDGAKGKIMAVVAVGIVALLGIGAVVALGLADTKAPLPPDTTSTQTAETTPPKQETTTPPLEKDTQLAAKAAVEPSTTPSTVEPTKIAAPPEPKTFKTSIQSSPSNAKVSLKGKQIGTTPFTYTYTQRVNVLVSMNGYKSKAITLEKEDTPSIRVSLTKKKRSTARPARPRPPKPEPKVTPTNDGFLDVLQDSPNKKKKKGFVNID